MSQQNFFLDKIATIADLKKMELAELPFLCAEIRQKIIEVMKKNGGHLASNLGAVELSVALHYVFNSPEDKIIFDVGHQCYTHKILTGRKDQIHTIRKEGGISGFTRRSESIHDFVDAGHASTSISQAVGFAVTHQLQEKQNRVIAIIGDGSLTGGVALEGLNFSGQTNLPLIVILNDNNMSIGKNVGAISDYISQFQVSKFYQYNKKAFETKMRTSHRLTRSILKLIYKIKRGFKFLFEYENVFTSLGYEYIGPIDGHNPRKLIQIFEKVKNNISHPVLIHIKTTKGKGYMQAEGNPTTFHGVTPYLMENGNIELKKASSFTDIFGQKMVELGKKHADLIAVTAAMGDGTGLTRFKKQFPRRFYDVGIAEQHAVSFCSTLAFGGFRPVFAVYSTFLLRAIDQVCQDVLIGQAPLIFAIDRAGIVGADGETHQGQFDITYLRMLPNIILLAPCDAAELRLMLEYAYHQKKPIAVRYPRDAAVESQLNDYHPDLEKNPLISLKKSKGILLIVIGPFVSIAKEAVLELKKMDIHCGLLYLRFLKPLPEIELLNEIKNYQSVVVIEENVLSGSVAEQIGFLIARQHLKVHFKSINLPDQFIEHANRQSILNKLGYCKENIITVCRELTADENLMPGEVLL